MPVGVYKRTEEHLEKIKERNKKHKWHLGFKNSEETKKKIRKSQPDTKGSKNPHWKGGKIKDRDGYILVKMPSHPFAKGNGYVYEHRLVMEKMLGRYLKPEERVHHKGTKYPMGSFEDKRDNHPKNLKFFPNESNHRKFHGSLT